MEVTITINGQALSMEVSVEVYECLDGANHKEENEKILNIGNYTPAQKKDGFSVRIASKIKKGVNKIEYGRLKVAVRGKWLLLIF